MDQSPEYTDIAVFLGRIYTWNDETEEARKEQEELITNMDALEKFAREHYLMKKDNEDIFIIEEED